jgi:hypothetical protein
VNVTGWSRGLEVTADGEGIVSHAGLILLRQLADKTGLTAGLSRALASPRLLIHDRGRVAADLACAIADGGEVISDLWVLTDQKELFGPVLLDVYCMAGTDLYNAILENVAEVHRRIPREQMLYALDIPYIARENSAAEIRALRKAWARAAG